MVGYSPRATQTPVSYEFSIHQAVEQNQAYLFCYVLHVSPDKTVTIGVEQSWKAVGILESYEVRFARVEIEMCDLERLDLLLGHLRPLQSLSQGRSGHW